MDCLQHRNPILRRRMKIDHPPKDYLLRINLLQVGKEPYCLPTRPLCYVRKWKPWIPFF